MPRVTAIRPGLSQSNIWYDPRFHFDVGIGASRVPSQNDEFRIESDNGTTLGFEFSTEGGLLTGILCLTFSGRAERGNAIAKVVPANVIEGCPFLSPDLGSAEIVYARPNSSRNVFATKRDIRAIIPSETCIQFLFGANPTQVIRVSEHVRIGTADSLMINLVEISDVPSEATKQFLIGSGRVSEANGGEAEKSGV